MTTAYNYLNQNITTIVKLCKIGVINNKVIRNIEVYEYLIATNIEETSLKYRLSQRQIYTIRKQMESKVW